MSVPNDENSWKIFQRDTEAGRILSRLYGVPPSSQQISYPKRRRRRRAAETGQNEGKGWKTTYTAHGLSKAQEIEKEEERKNNIARALSMPVPKVGSGQRHTVNGTGGGTAEVDRIPRRKTRDGCETMVERIKFVNGKYRPPVGHAFSSEEEKQRLINVFSRAGNSMNLEKEDAVDIECSPALVKPDNLFDQIYQEIVERRQHQMEMERLGAGENTRQSIVSEIQTRLLQLRRIDANKAAVVIKLLMK